MSIEPKLFPELSAKSSIELSKEPSLFREPFIELSAEPELSIESKSFSEPSAEPFKSSIEPELASISNLNSALELALPGSY